MFGVTDLERMHEFLDRPKLKVGHEPIQSPCCRGLGVFLFPGEREFIEARFPGGAYELVYQDDVSDLFKIAGMQWVYKCKECDPSHLPIGSKLYPTVGYVEEWTYRGITPDNDLFYPGPCEACATPEAFDPEFLRSAYGVWAWLCTDPKIASIVARISGHARQEGMRGYWTMDPEERVIWRAVGRG